MSERHPGQYDAEGTIPKGATRTGAPTVGGVGRAIRDQSAIPRLALALATLTSAAAAVIGFGMWRMLWAAISMGCVTILAAWTWILRASYRELSSSLAEERQQRRR